MISNRWKILAAALPIIGTLAVAQPQPGGLGGFFSAWWGGQAISWSPMNVDGLTMWLDASSMDYADITVIDGTNRVTRLVDRSGNNNDANQETLSFLPEYVENAFGDLGAAMFVSDYLWTTNNVFNFTNGASIFIVVQRFTGTFGGIHNYRGSPNQANHHPFGDNNFYDSFAIASRISFSWGFPTNLYLLETVASSAHSKYYRSGELKHTVTSPTLDNNSQNARIGQDSQVANGYYCEIALFEAAVSDEDREKLEGYFAHRWGFASDLPVSHPYKDAPP